jgi:hypothetical protein
MELRRWRVGSGEKNVSASLPDAIPWFKKELLPWCGN